MTFCNSRYYYYYYNVCYFADLYYYYYNYPFVAGGLSLYISVIHIQ